MSVGSSQPEHLDLRVLKKICSNCSLRELCVPMGLNRNEIESLDDLVQASNPMRSGGYLFRKGDRMRSIYAVRSGSYKSYTVNRDGEEQVLGFQG